MQRREFLRVSALTFPAGLAGTPFSRLVQAQSPPRSHEWHADLVVAGGGLGGCAAAMAAARAGRRVILTEPTDWIGGQLTSQAVPPDEHPWIESFGATASYRQLRQGIRQYYREHYPLTASARAEQYLNPGAGSVSRLCHEPRVALAVLYQMMAPYISSGHLSLLLRHQPIAADVQGDRIRSITCKSLPDGESITLTAPYFIDATETGDLLPLAGAEYVTGFEAQQQTGEPHAPTEPQPDNMQAATWCFPMQYVADGDFTISRPQQYNRWRSFVPELTPPWPGPLFDWTYSHPRQLETAYVGIRASQGGTGLVVVSTDH
jgi:hypothetical protein